MRDRTWRRHRVANTGLFVLTGLAMALWVVNIPAVQQRTGVSTGTLGLMLLLLGTGSVLGMQAAGWITDRYGSRRVAGLAVAMIAGAIVLPALATEAWHLAAALPLLGVGTGSITVAANDQAVTIQDAYGRPVMAAFHGFFSIAGALGAGLGAVLHAVDAPLLVALGTASVSAAVIGAASVPGLIGPEVTGGTADSPEPVATSAVEEGSILGPAVALASLAFLLNLAEGTATDWSALHAVQHLGASQSVASLAYGAFAAAMTAGRLTVDRVVAQVGPVVVVRAGSALATVGIAAVVLAPTFPTAVAGWMVFGLGISGIVPQLFTAAGALSVARRGTVLSRVVGVGYAGMLAGPAVVGWVADAVGLDRALLTTALCCVAGVLLAGFVRPRVARPGARIPATTGR
jgi:MFS family permease